MAAGSKPRARMRPKEGMELDATRARYPALTGGGYESFYVKAHHPTEPEGFWIRYTVLVTADGSRRASLWLTLFGEDAPAALKHTRADGLSTGDGAWLRIGDARIGVSGLAGAIQRDGIDGSWDLRFSSNEPPLFHLPRDWMYRAALPRTKPITLLPRATFDGAVRLGERALRVEGWAGMVGHNWGAEHAERWIWLHALGFDEDPHAWLDLTIGRVKVGPVTTPWIANGVLWFDGVRRRLGGIERVRQTEVRERTDGCSLRLPGKGFTLEVEARAPQHRFVGWRYADPDGSEHRVLNCSIADVAVTIARDEGPDTTLSVQGGGAYELGTRERDHDLPIQPWGEEIASPPDQSLGTLTDRE